MVSPKQDPPSAEGLNSVEAEFVAFFVQMATALSLPRSVGEIFGYLFAADEPKPFDEVVSRLGISKGSASQGLKFLLGMGAISTVYVPRDRRTFYEAETKMRKLFSRALQESVRPHLEANGRLIDAIEEHIDLAPDHESREEHYRARAASLKGWNDKALQLLPLLDKLISVPVPSFPFKFFGGDSSGENGKPKTPPAKPGKT